MNRQPITSTSIESAGYDPAAHVVEVKFNNGSVYQYHHVSGPIYRAFLHADSKGAFLNTRIKPDHPCTRIE